MKSVSSQTMSSIQKGNIRAMIDKIIITYAKDDELIKKVITSRLLLKGIQPSKYSADTPDDKSVIQLLAAIDRDLAKLFAD